MATTVFQDRALRGLDRLPPFSPVLNRLLTAVASDGVSFADLAVLIESDAVLTGNVLRAVNSALCGAGSAVSSVRHAVAILGVERLHNLSLSLSIARMCSQVRTTEGWSNAKFSAHSLAVGILSDLIAQGSAAPYPEGAFVAGLMHDIGKLLIATALPTEFAGIQRLLKQGEQTELGCEMQTIGATHADLSGLALARWNLPLPIQHSATFHHAPDRADEGRPHLSHVVCAADRLANDFGHCAGYYFEPCGPVGGAWAALNLDERMPRILEGFQDQFEKMNAFL
jgi:HD-like signal output (HDOD) protein